MLDLFLIIFEQVFIYLPLILGAYLSFSLLKIPNLSIEAAYVTGAIVAGNFSAYSLGASLPIILVFNIILSMIGGAFVGVIVCLIQAKGKIPFLLSSILTLGICYGINLYLWGAGNKSLSGNTNPLLVLVFFKSHPEFFCLACISLFFLLMIVLLFKTQIGYSFAIYGNNPNFFQHYGICTNFITFFGIILGNSLVGLSGYLSAQTSGFVDVNSGQGISLFCITALILGKSTLKEKTAFSAIVSLLGVIFYCSLQQNLVSLGFSLKYFSLIQSLIVLGILIIKYQKNSDDKSSSTDLLGI